MKNLLTFTTASGTTQLRGYVKVALGLFVILVALFGVNAYNRNQMVTEVMATPRSLDSGQMPVSTERAVIPVQPVAEECPSDPADWTLTENISMLGSNLKGLSPQCVYDQLDRSAAWLYATYVLGYSRQEAAGLFGFSSAPMQYNFDGAEITVITDFKDIPQKVSLRFPNSDTGLREWRIDTSGNPSVEFTFNGCFRTSTFSGGEVSEWGNGYPVLCQYAITSRSGYYVADVNGKPVTVTNEKNVRRPMWFGYDRADGWVFLGVAKDWAVDLSHIANLGASTLNPTVMVQKYGVGLNALPENWMTFTGQQSVDAFVQELNETD